MGSTARTSGLLKLIQQGSRSKLRECQLQFRGQARPALTRLFASEPAKSTDTHEEKHEAAKMVNEGGADHKPFEEARDEASSSRGSDALEESHGIFKESARKADEAADRSKETVQETAGQAKEKAQEMMEQGKETARSAVDKTKEMAEQAAGKAKQKVEETGKAMKQTTHETPESTKGMAKDVSGKVESMAEGVENAAKREVNTAADMLKGIPQKTAETTEGLKGVAVEAAKAVKRDVEKLAEKVGVKESKPGDLDRSES